MKKDEDHMVDEKFFCGKEKKSCKLSPKDRLVRSQAHSSYHSSVLNENENELDQYLVNKENASEFSSAEFRGISDIYAFDINNRRYKISSKDIIIIHKLLKARRGLVQSLKQRSTSFDGFLYRSHSLSERDFQLLKSFLKKEFGGKILVEEFGLDDIPSKILAGYSSSSYLELPENSITAELVGILLGDGHINSKFPRIEITLNKIDENLYFDYVINLLSDVLKDRNLVNTVDDKRGKASIIKVHNRSVYDAVLRLGLTAGKKTELNVSVPAWIFTSRNYMLSCLRGLLDTDGSIYVTQESHLGITFTSASFNLVSSFRELCIQALKFSPQNISGNTSFNFSINAVHDVKTFLDQVKPTKFQDPSRRLWLGLYIIFQTIPEVYKIIRNKIDFQKDKGASKIFQYSLKNLDLLHKWVVNALDSRNILSIFDLLYSGVITSRMVDHILKKSFELNRQMYDSEEAKKYYNLFKQLGSFQRIEDYLSYKGDRLVSERSTIKKHLVKYFSDTFPSRNIDGFLDTYRLSRITFNEYRDGFQKFPVKIRDITVIIIYEILENNYSLYKDDFKSYYNSLLYELNREGIILITWLLNDPHLLKYNFAMESYLFSIIKVIYYFYTFFIGKEPVSFKEIHELSGVSFSVNWVSGLINNLAKVKGLSFESKVTGKIYFSDKYQFLKDIKDFKSLEVQGKYDIGERVVTRLCKELLGRYGVYNFKSAKQFLKNVDINSLLFL